VLDRSLLGFVARRHHYVLIRCPCSNQPRFARVVIGGEAARIYFAGNENHDVWSRRKPFLTLRGNASFHFIHISSKHGGMRDGSHVPVLVLPGQAQGEE
jgi:hypothetical protein